MPKSAFNCSDFFLRASDNGRSSIYAKTNNGMYMFYSYFIDGIL